MVNKTQQLRWQLWTKTRLITALDKELRHAWESHPNPQIREMGQIKEYGVLIHSVLNKPFPKPGPSSSMRQRFDLVHQLAQEVAIGRRRTRG
jgi:hypothetical protein